MPPPLHPPSTADLRRVEPQIWRACAGSSVQIPTLHSRVYYFPRGHLEHLRSPAPTLPFPPLVHCHVTSVDLLADPVTDEVFARLSLLPIQQSDPNLDNGRDGYDNGGYGSDNGGDDKITAFSKILTPSDANNGGGFSVPRFCADSVFPQLNYSEDPPVQTLSVVDVRGGVWEFRHIYRGTPRRHLLTTGWSKYVNSKKLIAGDSVVFMRNGRGEMFIGVRRAVRDREDCTRWRDGIGGRGIAVAEAVERAAKGMQFEVVYHPKVAGGWAEFVVRAEVVEKAVGVGWVPGMRVKMAVETEDSSRMTWFQGTVASAAVAAYGPLRGSPWRMLEVLSFFFISFLGFH